MSQSRPRTLAERKQHLKARAAIERLQLAAHCAQLKASTRPSTLFRSLMPKVASQQGMTTALRLWSTARRYPFVSSALSVMLTKITPRFFLPALKVGGIAFIAYEAFKLYRDYQHKR
ncbi:MAG: hypothetical protein M0Q54_10220 [Pigmentiphaga sp.]|nr:hypothetical protein [Pigmentiphaga sp.]